MLAFTCVCVRVCMCVCVCVCVCLNSHMCTLIHTYARARCTGSATSNAEAWDQLIDRHLNGCSTTAIRYVCVCVRIWFDFVC